MVDEGVRYILENKDGQDVAVNVMLQYEMKPGFEIDDERDYGPDSQDDSESNEEDFEVDEEHAWIDEEVYPSWYDEEDAW